jgi:copper chaperone
MKLAIPDMSCGHCKAVVEQTIKSLDPAAEVQVDLATREVEVTTAVAPDLIVAALAAQGYQADQRG